MAEAMALQMKDDSATGRTATVNAAKMDGKALPEPTVVAVRIEKLEDSYIQWLSPIPERLANDHSVLAAYLACDANINELIDLRQDILDQYNEKGYAMVRVEYLDNGLKRLFRVPEDVTA